MLYPVVTFEEFAGTIGVSLRAGLVAAFGPDSGIDAAANGGCHNAARLTTSCVENLTAFRAADATPRD